MSEPVRRIKAPVRLAFEINAGHALTGFLRAIAQGRFVGQVEHLGAVNARGVDELFERQRHPVRGAVEPGAGRYDGNVHFEKFEWAYSFEQIRPTGSNRERWPRVKN